MKFENTSAVVTGAASGLGAVTAATLAARGTRVIGIDLPSSIEKAAAVSGVTLVAADVTNEEQVVAAVAIAAADPAAPLRIVVNCAGIAPSSRTLGRTGRHDLSLYRKVIEINLIGSFTVLSIAAEEIAKTDADENGQRGVVINTASVAAYEGQIGQVAYSSSKGGIVGLTIPAARDLSAVGIRVCTIAPGIVDTPMLATISQEIRDGLSAGVPFPKRLCRPDEYAQLATMIIEHDYLNGETIRLDGALRMAPR